ncbi:Cytochrome P450 [Corchorus olitorius]|uniref:Cytochrome P450 n=1 Tax=Corchorus olitorius TaxID=93759 RepID=A0A1R3GXV4_9ROSI|nr:Cytochrome P450 [Corchorus olitorius]
METWWFLILSTISIALLLKAFLNLFYSSNKIPHTLPPGPPTFPIIGNILWLRKSFSQIEPTLRDLHSKLGPMVTLHIGSRPTVFVFDRNLAHQALVQSGSLFSDRPKALATNKVISSNQHNISSAPYGPNWRLFRRNLTSEILHPSRIKSYSHARKWVLEILFDGLQSKAKTGEPVQLSQDQIKEIESVLRKVLLSLGRFNMLNFWPRVTKVLLRKKWEEFLQLRKDQENVLIPLIRARKKAKEENLRSKGSSSDDYVLAYVDTLLDLELPEEKRKLEEGEMEDTVLGGFLVPKNGTINFMVADMGWDPKVWEDPMAFKPERFLKSDGDSKEVFDITGSREIKMMPFGVGRRICPGLGLAMLHLEYFVANLVWKFEWKAIDGDEISLEEKQEFTMVMKTPLQAHISPRKR